MAATHAITLRDPADPTNPDRSVACGEIGGAPISDGSIAVDLRESNGSGVTAVAWLWDRSTHDNPGTHVHVRANVGGMAGGPDGATPMASPPA